jgi:hypothetical protein
MQLVAAGCPRPSEPTNLAMLCCNGLAFYYAALSAQPEQASLALWQLRDKLMLKPLLLGNFPVYARLKLARLKLA